MRAAPANVTRYLEDSSGYRGEADQAFLPSDLEELREIVRSASARRIAITVAGAGTGLTGARVPQGGWVVSLERFRNLRIESGRARCGAGVILADLHRAAAERQQFLGPNPTETSACIGGIIGTNAGGARSFHYGQVRKHILALEVMLIDGRTIRCRRGDRVDFPVRPVHAPNTTKNAAGYYLRPDLDWVDLVCGSEGTLGIVTEAELQLFREPEAILSGVVFFGSEDDALRTVTVWRSIPELRFLEYMDGHALDLLRPNYSEIPASARAALLVEQNLESRDDAEIDLWADRLRERQALEETSWFGFEAGDRERFRAFRHALPLAVLDLIRRNGFPKTGTDFAVPLAREHELLACYQRSCEAGFPGQYTIFGHAGDANNHVDLLPTTPRQAQAAEALMRDFAGYVVSLGGTVAAEHGIGKTKTDLLAMMYSTDEIEAMREVKRHLDPRLAAGPRNDFRVRPRARNAYWPAGIHFGKASRLVFKCHDVPVTGSDRLELMRVKPSK